MENMMNGSVLSKFMPVFDLFLLLILIMFGLGGLVQLTGKSDPKNAGINQPHLSLDEIVQQINELSAEIERMRHELDKKKAEAASFERQLGAAKRKSTFTQHCEITETTLTKAREKLQKIRNEVAQKKMNLQKLEQKKKALAEEKALLEKQRSNLAVKTSELRQIEEKNKALAEEIARLQRELHTRRNPVIKVESTPLIAATTKRTPVYVTLINGIVAPVQEPFYTLNQKVVDHGGGRFEAIDVASWNRKGESADQALARRSAFSQVLKDINPEENYVALLVDSSSFETFRTIREVLRDQNIPFGWEPSSRTRFRFSPNGQLIGEEVEEGAR